MNIDGWKKFKISDIFEVKKTKNIVAEEAMSNIGNDICYVTRTEFNNGVKHFVIKNFDNIEKSNSITIGGEGANVYYQPFDYVTGNNITKIYNKKLTENSGLFIVTLLNLEKYKYSYNRAFNKTFVEHTIILLPAKDNEPDWEYMENYIKKLREREIERVLNLLNN